MIIPSKFKRGHLTLSNIPTLGNYLIGKSLHRSKTTNLFNASSSATNFMLNYLSSMGLKTNHFKNDPWKTWTEREK